VAAIEGKRPQVPKECPMPYCEMMTLCWHAKVEKHPTITKVVSVLSQLLSVDSENIWQNIPFRKCLTAAANNLILLSLDAHTSPPGNVTPNIQVIKTMRACCSSTSSYSNRDMQ